MIILNLAFIGYIYMKRSKYFSRPIDVGKKGFYLVTQPFFGLMLIDIVRSINIFQCRVKKNIGKVL